MTLAKEVQSVGGIGGITVNVERFVILLMVHAIADMGPSSEGAEMMAMLAPPSK